MSIVTVSDKGQALISFDDKGFARRAQRLELKPAVKVPGEE